MGFVEKKIPGSALYRKKLVDSQSRRERACKRTGDVSVTFFGEEEQGSGRMAYFSAKGKK